MDSFYKFIELYKLDSDKFLVIKNYYSYKDDLLFVYQYFGFVSDFTQS